MPSNGPPPTAVHLARTKNPIPQLFTPKAEMCICLTEIYIAFVSGRQPTFLTGGIVHLPQKPSDICFHKSRLQRDWTS